MLKSKYFKLFSHIVVFLLFIEWIQFRYDPAEYNSDFQNEITSNFYKRILPFHYGIHLKMDGLPSKLTYEGFVNIIFEFQHNENEEHGHDESKITKRNKKMNKNRNKVYFHSLNHDIQTIQIEEHGTEIPLLVRTWKCSKRTQGCWVYLYKSMEFTKHYHLKIWYQSKIAKHALNGVYVSQEVDEKRFRPLIVSTHFEPFSARKAFPCFDEPKLKAQFSLNVIVPFGLNVVSNMPVLKFRVNSMNQIKERFPRNDIEQKNYRNYHEEHDHVGTFWEYQFKTTPKMSTYLVAFAISKFKNMTENVQGLNYTTIPITIFYQTKEQEWAAKEALDSAVFALQCYEKMFDVAYPLPKMDLIPVKHFGGEAMENFGLLIFEERLLLLDKATHSIQEKEDMHALVSHEIAHQWFGDLVTMSSWSELFLNEGFAEFFQYHCTKEPRDLNRLEKRFYMYENLLAFDADVIPSLQHPVYPVHPKDKELVSFDDITYDKGAVVLRMLQEWLKVEKLTYYDQISNYNEFDTESSSMNVIKRKGLRDCGIFCDGLKEYLVDNAFSAAHVSQLLKALDKLLPPNTSYSGIKPGEFALNWLENPGYPVLDVSIKESAPQHNRNICSLILQQSPYALDRHYKPNIVWHIPVFYKIISKYGYMILNHTDDDLIVSEEGNDDLVIKKYGKDNFVLMSTSEMTVDIYVPPNTSCEDFIPIVNVRNIGLFRVKYSSKEALKTSEWIYDHYNLISAQERTQFVSDLLWLLVSGNMNDILKEEILNQYNVFNKANYQPYEMHPNYHWVFKSVEKVMVKESDWLVWSIFEEQALTLLEIFSRSHNADDDLSHYNNWLRSVVYPHALSVSWETIAKIVPEDSTINISDQSYPTFSKKSKNDGFINEHDSIEKNYEIETDHDHEESKKDDDDDNNEDTDEDQKALTKSMLRLCIVSYCHQPIIEQSLDLFDRFVNNTLQADKETVGLIIMSALHYAPSSKNVFSTLLNMYLTQERPHFNILLNGLTLAVQQEDQIQTLALLKSSTPTFTSYPSTPIQWILPCLYKMLDASTDSHLLVWQFVEKEWHAGAHWRFEVSESKLNGFFESLISRMTFSPTFSKWVKKKLLKMQSFKVVWKGIRRGLIISESRMNIKFGSSS